MYMVQGPLHVNMYLIHVNTVNVSEYRLVCVIQSSNMMIWGLLGPRIVHGNAINIIHTHTHTHIITAFIHFKLINELFENPFWAWPVGFQSFQTFTTLFCMLTPSYPERLHSWYSGNEWEISHKAGAMNHPNMKLLTGTLHSWTKSLEDQSSV